MNNEQIDEILLTMVDDLFESLGPLFHPVQNLRRHLVIQTAPDTFRRI